ncbi:MAG: hypothetical protein STSR0008_05940 [Ignavibacterium sp.]
MENTKSKKIRIFNLAAEYNIASENLIEFLKRKGFDVKTHMSVVTDDMVNEIHDHFKKDLEKAEKHHKKVEEFQKKISKSKEEEIEKVEKIPIKKSTEKIKPKETLPKELEEKKEEIIEVEPKIPAEISNIEEIPKVEIGAEQEVSLQPINGPSIPGDNKKVETDEVKKDVFRTETEKLLKKQNGLKVIGKIDLTEKKVKTVIPSSSPEVPEVEISDRVPEEFISEIIEDKEIVKKKKKKPKKKKADKVQEDLVTKKKSKIKKIEIDEKEVKESIRKTLLSMDDSILSSRALVRKRKKKEREEEEIKKQEIIEANKNKIQVTEYISVNELANLMNIPVNEVIQKCISLGLMVSINQRLDYETITLVADEFGFEVELMKEFTSDALEDTEDPPESLKPRSPVVTIMGHVDHGKTSLLDYIRKTNVVAGETGGITQHIGAYKVEYAPEKYITFLDTPGHEAFTAMRARGAQVTDIIVLVVAADDAVMPQTVEAINHALAANAPIIVAINKIDKPGINIDKIKQQLAERKVLVEDWGGKYQCVEISAKTGKNVDVLLEKILLEAELLDLKANPDRKARGVIIESEIDKGRGVTSTVLVQKGTLRVGDPFVAGIQFGKVRAMFDERNRKVFEVGPSTPVLILGLEGPPQAGDNFVVLENERLAREIVLKRQQLKREQDQKQIKHITLDEISKQISIGGIKELPIIVKGDVDGSVEALSDSLMKLSTDEVKIRVIHRGVGAISESDVLLASASDAIIIGFHVRPNLNARKLAETQNVDIRLYNIIYDAINEVKLALEGLLTPIITEEVTASAEVRDTFKISKVGTVAGCYVQEGKLMRNNKVRVIRNGIVIFDGEISSLKRLKDDVREVDSGFECGLSVANFNDIKVGDVIEGYKLIETKKKL